MKMLDYIYEIKGLVLTPKTSKWCQIPYPGHPHGCPNYAKKDGCPPAHRALDEVLDINRPMYLIRGDFDLEAHAKKMLDKHPHWSRRQSRCVLYWQSSARKQLKERIEEAHGHIDFNHILRCPEAKGCNIYAMARKAGLYLEKIKDLKICHKIAMVGFATSQD